MRCGCGTADAIGDLTSALEKARAKLDTMHIMLLGVCRVFDSIPHSLIQERLSLHGAKGPLFGVLASFLRGRSLVVKACGLICTSRDIAQGVPPGCVLSPHLFNMVMAALPRVISFSTGHPVRMAFHTDDLIIWCVASLDKAVQFIQAFEKSCQTSRTD